MLSSADVIANNDDLLTKILLHLPVKSLLKFKSVSKHWLSLISDPTFLFCHNTAPKSASGLFLQWRDHDVSKLLLFNNSNNNLRDAPICMDHRKYCDINISYSCNGLLLVECVAETMIDYYVYNPTIKQFAMLPKLTCHTALDLNLAFDPSKSPYYKVVCISSSSGLLQDRYQILIYSSGERGTWRISGDPFSAGDTKLCLDGGVYWNGAIHWVKKHLGVLLYFDVDEERFCSMPMPPAPDGGDYLYVWRPVAYFGESRGHLHLAEICALPSMQIYIYEMEKEHSGWFVKYLVDLALIAAPIATMFPPRSSSAIELLKFVFPRCHILCVVREDTEEESFLVIYMRGKVISYELEHKTVKKISDFCAGETFNWSYAFQYIESLCCV